MNTKQTDLVLGQELRQLVQRAEQGDLAVLPALRKLLDETPALWRQYGDLARQAELAWLNLMSGSNLVLKESILRKVDELKEELGGDATSPLERLLIARIVTCWLQVHHADLNLAQFKERNAPAEQIKLVTHFQDRAQQRYLTSIKQLATVRKLLRPAPSPMEIATRLNGPTRRPPVARGRTLETVGVGVEN